MLIQLRQNKLGFLSCPINLDVSYIKQIIKPVETVLTTLEQGLEQITVEAVGGEGDALMRLGRMCDRISDAYNNGQKPCLLAALLLGSAKEVFQDKVQTLLKAWIDAIATVLIEAGMDSAIAHQRGEDGVIAIQGALILAQGLNDPAPFQRVLQQLPQKLCEGIVEN